MAEVKYDFKPYLYHKLTVDHERPYCSLPLACDDENAYFSDELDLFRFNFSSKKWKKLNVNDFPPYLYQNVNTALLSGNIFFAYEGFKRNRAVKKLYVWNLVAEEKNCKTIETKSDIEPCLEGQAAFIKGQYYYTIGGKRNNEYFMDIHRFDMETSLWEEVCVLKGKINEPIGRSEHKIGISGSKIYVFGGYKYLLGSRKSFIDFKNVPVFDLEVNCWSNVNTEPDKVYGYPEPNIFLPTYNTSGRNSFIFFVQKMTMLASAKIAWEFHVPTLSWKRIEFEFLTETDSDGLKNVIVTPSGKVYFIGDGSNWYTAFTGEIPKLSDISWDAVIHYDLLKDRTLEELNLLLPVQFIKKLT